MEEQRINLTKEEIETIINYTNADDYADVYSNNINNIKKYEKLAKENPEEVQIIQLDINSITIRIPKKWVKVRPPRKMSEENKQKAAERLRALRNKNNLDDDTFSLIEEMLDKDDELDNDDDFM